jgi:hypothetical protein
MDFANQVTKLDTYKQYLHEIGSVPSYQLDTSFACGLPEVWLYMKSIGLEDIFFELLEKAKTRPQVFKELFYLLMLTNGENKFFPHIPADFLKLDIPPAVADAQVEIRKPDFAIAYSFTRDQLLDILKLIALPNVMVRMGNERKAIGVMFKDNIYHVYHADNPRALEFKNIDGCVDSIMRVMQNG